MVENKRLMLVKQQTTEGTPETSLTATDFVEVFKDSKISPDVPVAELEIISGGFNQYAAVLGKHQANVNLVFPLRNFGSGVRPQFAVPLVCSGFEEVENNGYYIYTPIDTEIPDCTVCDYSGALGANESWRATAGNVKFNPKIMLDFSGDCYGKIEFSGVGRYGTPSPETQVLPTKNYTVVPPLKSVTLTLLGDSTYYDPLSLEIDMTQPVENKVQPSHESGAGFTNVTDRKVKFSTRFYQTISNNTISAWLAGTETTTSVSYSASNEIQVILNNCQMTKVDSSDENGIQTYDVEGQVNRNDITIRIAGGEASSSSSA